MVLLPVMTCTRDSRAALWPTVDEGWEGVKEDERSRGA